MAQTNDNKHPTTTSDDLPTYTQSASQPRPPQQSSERDEDFRNFTQEQAHWPPEDAKPRPKKQSLTAEEQRMKDLEEFAYNKTHVRQGEAGTISMWDFRPTVGMTKAWEPRNADGTTFLTPSRAAREGAPVHGLVSDKVGSHPPGFDEVEKHDKEQDRLGKKSDEKERRPSVMDKLKEKLHLDKDSEREKE